MMNCVKNKRLNKKQTKEEEEIKHMSKNYERMNLLYSHIIKSIVQKRLHAHSLLKCKYSDVIHSLAL